MFESLLKNMNSIITARLADVKNKEKRVSKIISNTFEMWFDFLKYGHTNPFLKLLQNPAPYCHLFLSFLGGVRDEIVYRTGADSGEAKRAQPPSRHLWGGGSSINMGTRDVFLPRKNCGGNI